MGSSSICGGRTGGCCGTGAGKRRSRTTSRRCSATCRSTGWRRCGATPYWATPLQAARRPFDDAGDRPTDHSWDDPELALTLIDIVSCLEKAQGLLTPKQQRLIELRHHQGCQYDEIAAELGISTGTVGTNLADAERALRRRLTGECKELVEDTVSTSLASRPRENP